MDRHELPRGRERDMAIHALEEQPTVRAIRAPEEPGAFCFPPLASLITAGARLRMLGIEPPADPIAACATLLDKLGESRA